MNKKKKEILKRIEEIEDLMKGSLSVTYRSCGKEGCKCQRGRKHKGYFFSYRVKGTPKVAYIPQRIYPKVKELVENWLKMKRLIEELTEVNLNNLKK